MTASGMVSNAAINVILRSGLTGGSMHRGLDRTFSLWNLVEDPANQLFAGGIVIVSRG
jgi:hypothetical protein